MSTGIPLVAQPDLAGQVAALERDGYVYLPGVLTADEVAELREAMDRLTPNPESYDWHQTSDRDSRLDKAVNNTFNRDPVFLQYLDREGVIEIAEAVHGEDCHVLGMTAWVTGPGRPQQQLHTDWLPIPLPEDVLADPRVRVPIFITTAHYYLDDIDEELGPTQFIPASHLSGRSPGEETSWRGVEPQSVLCNAGDVVVFRSEVWHRGTANTSDRVRYLLQVHHSRRMITQMNPPYFGKFQFAPHVLDDATPRQRRLLGEHKSGAYA
jgi:ectoine hydroxylase-related dioxygenase (phytanoyl-CoA dioxygenase family)